MRQTPTTRLIAMLGQPALSQYGESRDRAARDADTAAARLRYRLATLTATRTGDAR